MKKWKHPNSAPKNCTVFIGCFGKRKEVKVCVWSDVENEWVSASLQANLYQGQWNDYYFEGQNEPKDELCAWIDIPDVNE